MTQDGLIKNILKNFGMDDYNPKTIPKVVQDPFGTDAKGNPMQYQDWWKYASVITILVYVANNSSPEIAFIVHKCARFTHNYKQSYEKSVMRIYNYIQGNIKDGKARGLSSTLQARRCLIYA